jgi:hypothetical protein
MREDKIVGETCGTPPDGYQLARRRDRGGAIQTQSGHTICLHSDEGVSC